MTKILTYISRLLISYSKFGIMIFSLSLINTALKSDDNFRYLTQSSQFLKLGGVYINEEKNIRKRKLVNKYIKLENGKYLMCKPEEFSLAITALGQNAATYDHCIYQKGYYSNLKELSK